MWIETEMCFEALLQETENLAQHIGSASYSCPWHLLLTADSLATWD